MTHNSKICIFRVKKMTSADEDALKLRSPWAIYAKENE